MISTTRPQTSSRQQVVQNESLVRKKKESKEFFGSRIALGDEFVVNVMFGKVMFRDRSHASVAWGRDVERFKIGSWTCAGVT